MSQYATVADLFRHGMPPTARGNMTDAQLNAALVSASTTADSYLRGRYAYPLVAWGDDLRKYVCWVASYELLTGPRGMAPGAGADSNIGERNNLAIEWFQGVQRKAIHPDITPSDNQSPTYDQPFVVSSSVVDVSTGRTAATRGW